MKHPAAPPALSAAQAAGSTPQAWGNSKGMRRPMMIGLVNNMPDSALESTESQFGRLLEAASGTRRLTLRLSSLPGVPRSGAARARVASTYWPLDELLADHPEALIVTGTEPRAPRLTEEPYWQQLVALLSWAEAHTASSIWSCLAAHAVVESLDGIRRQRLTEKRLGVYAHSIRMGHPLLEGVAAPLRMPHSRWNELPPDDLREAGYTLLGWSAQTGVDAFVREGKSLLLFFQGHPEYDDTTLLKEYRRDIGRYLSGQQTHYPGMPCGYFPPDAVRVLDAFRERALAERSPALLGSFPFTEAAAGLHNTWRAPAVSIYRNWLSLIAAARRPEGQTDTVSLAPL